MSLQQTIKDLIFFYVKSNYEKYLTENDMKTIPDSEIDNIINKLYDQRKSHIQVFIKDALKQLYKNKIAEYPGDQTITNILLNIFQDDNLCKNRVIIEIKLHQASLINKKK
jgi:hypothetical protein